MANPWSRASGGMIVTTTAVVEGKPVQDYLGIVTGEVIVGANLFRANLSVSWFSDRERLVADLLPKDGEDPIVATFMQVWQRLDNP